MPGLEIVRRCRDVLAAAREPRTQVGLGFSPDPGQESQCDPIQKEGDLRSLCDICDTKDDGRLMTLASGGHRLKPAPTSSSVEPYASVLKDGTSTTDFGEFFSGTESLARPHAGSDGD